MRKLILILAMVAFFLIGCKKEKIIENEPEEEIVQDEIPFTGSWSREFMVADFVQTVTYSIYEDSVRYTMTGDFAQTDYLIIRDVFQLENNRFIGHTDLGEYYTMFVKPSADSIVIYKQTVADVAEGMALEVPNEDTEVSYGWNIYK